MGHLWTQGVGASCIQCVFASPRDAAFNAWPTTTAGSHMVERAKHKSQFRSCSNTERSPWRNDALPGHTLTHSRMADPNRVCAACVRGGGGSMMLSFFCFLFVVHIDCPGTRVTTLSSTKIFFCFAVGSPSSLFPSHAHLFTHTRYVSQLRCLLPNRCAVNQNAFHVDRVWGGVFVVGCVVVSFFICPFRLL